LKETLPTVLFDSYTPVYYWAKECESKFCVMQGGTSSSKTHSIMQNESRECIEWDGKGKAVTTVVAETSDSLERGALRDFKNLIESSPLLRACLLNPNLVRGPYKFKSGAILEFVHLGDLGKAKHGKRRRLYLNEGNHLDFEIAEKMIVRTDGQVTIDYNSDARFWAHEEILTRDNAELFISNYTHNPYVSQDIIDQLIRYKTKWQESGDQQLRKAYEEIKDSDNDKLIKKIFNKWNATSSTHWRNKWYVYGLGLTGIIEGVIYPDIVWIPRLPLNLIKRAYIIDWGFNPDPCAISLMGMKRGGIYGKELFYKTDQTTPQIMDFMRSIGVTKKDLIIADPANMDAITQFKRKGFNIVEANKFPGSIKSGINSLKGHDMYLTDDSIYWKIEQENYKYIMRHGKSTGTPVDKHNHLWDGARYYYHHWYPPKKKTKKGTRHKRRIRSFSH